MCATRAARAAVHGVSLGLHAGDIGVLIGPSGCGKTTLLRAVAGLEPVSSGEIRLTKSVVSSATLSVPPEQRRIGMVFQDYALFPHLSVGRNVAFGIHQLPAPNKLPAWPRCCNWWAWKAARTATPRTLGRPAAARWRGPCPGAAPAAHAAGRAFSNLDVDLRERLAHEVRGILKAAGATALFVTHDQFEAFAIGDVIGVMHEGHLHQWDDAYTLYHRPPRGLWPTSSAMACLPGHAGAARHQRGGPNPWAT